MHVGVLGKKGVGKTSIIHRILYDTFSLIYKQTYLTEYYSTDIGITFWDIVQKPKQKMDILLFVTKDNDYTLLEKYPPLPIWVAIVEKDVDIHFCASHRVFEVSNMSKHGIHDLFMSILKYYISNFSHQ